jgi:ABC-type antimicrobial peptide transport system permease subunit
METGNRQVMFTPDLFEPVHRSAEDAEKITGSPTGFWSDAWRRMKRNLVIITLMYTVPTAVFFEAFLSFIGLGIQPPAASLGALINDGADQMRFYPYLLVFPAAVLVMITISFRLLGDGLRDALDPRMRR